MGGAARMTIHPQCRSRWTRCRPASARDGTDDGESTSWRPAAPGQMEYGRPLGQGWEWACDKYEGFQNNVKKMEICP